MATSLTVEGAFAAHRVHELAVAASRRFVLILLPLTLTLVVAAPLVLLPFGRAYAEHGSTVLRILAVASLFRALTTFNDALCRITGRGLVLALSSAMRCAVALVLTVLLANAWGLAGVGIAWLAAYVAVAAMVAPMLWKFFHHAGVGGADGSHGPGGESLPGGPHFVADGDVHSNTPADPSPSVLPGARHATGYRESAADFAHPVGLPEKLHSSREHPWPALDANLSSAEPRQRPLDGASSDVSEDAATSVPVADERVAGRRDRELT
jgi:hypothetical protein